MKIIAAVLALAVLVASASAQAIASTPAVALSQQKAVDKYPDIGVKGSDLNLAFVDVFNHWKVWKKEVLMRDDWPELVAEQAVSTLLSRRREEDRRKKQVIEIQR